MPGRLLLTEEFEQYNGKKFGRLTVFGVFRRKEKDGASHIYFKCKCECGIIKYVKKRNILRGMSKSCGCYAREALKKRNKLCWTKHGLRYHPLYHVWTNIVSRCEYLEDKSYHYYGGRGITVCEEWRHDPQKFIEYMLQLGWESGLTIDRIDCNGSYSPGNIRIANRKEQANNRRNNFLINDNGTIQTLQQLADSLNMNPCTLKHRFKLGWSLKDIKEIPIGYRCKNRL